MIPPAGPRPTPPAGGWHNSPRPPKPGNWGKPRPGGWNHTGSRWGNKIGGHWYAGHNAPGGWNGYRRPYRGWVLPSYWIAPSFYISDYSSYGLSAPPYGYNWSRYYDDAVLMDQRGQVWDSVSGIDWDRYDDGYAYDDGYYDDGQDGYAEPGAPYPAPPVVYGEPAEVVQGSTYGSSYQQGGYVSGGYWYPPVTTTTVTVNQAPAEVITTTTEYIDTVTYTAPRKTYAKKKVWRPKTKVRQCACQCRC
jgi:Ni/Co efflux regulator RcnB